MKAILSLFLFSALFLNTSCSEKSDLKIKEIIVHSPKESINELKKGNQRFLNDELININHLEQIEITKHGHQPHSVILSCMDSRVPPEIIFDQGIGNIFVIRNAGNLEDRNVLGSIEYTINHSTAKLIVVMGHSHCGAVTGAVNDIKHGHLSQLVEQIKPSIKHHKSHPNVINITAKHSVKATIDDIVSKSSSIRNLIKKKKIKIVGAFYDIETGIVTFM